MRSIKLSVLSLGLALGVSSVASAQQVNFDDATNYAFLSNGYSGFNWSNAFVANAAALGGSSASGFFNVGAGSQVLVNGGGNALEISGGKFNLLSGKFASAWTNGLNLNVKGYSEGNLLYNSDYALSWTNASMLGLNLLGVDRVVFSSAGGTVDPSFERGSNQSFGADNLEFSEYTSARIIIEDPDVSVNVVPEPMTVTLMAAGLLVLGGAQARRRRTAQAR